MLYWILKNSIRLGLYYYHKKIEVHGLENIPKNKPVLFLPNHQNALIDVLLVGVDCNRKPYFLTRSDVFGGRILNTLFNYVRMIPIYRIRDGRNTLSKNDAVFNSCAQVLGEGNAIVMFPEGNHNLKRRVRPLSKGFTRVLFRALERSPELDIQLIPVGLNYLHAAQFPDSATIYYGTPISVQALYDKEDAQGSIVRIKEAVASQLKTLTTHISPKIQYAEITKYLVAKNVDFLDPIKTNHAVKQMVIGTSAVVEAEQFRGKQHALFQSIFLLLNFPVILFWRLAVKSKVPEAEFIGTFRFAASFIGFFVYYGILLTVFTNVLNFWWALGCIGFLSIFNLCYVKWPRLNQV